MSWKATRSAVDVLDGKDNKRKEKGRRGRPRNRQTDNVQQYTRMKAITNWKEEVHNRKDWTGEVKRTIVKLQNK